MGYCYWNNFCFILFFYFIDMKITAMRQVLFGEQKLDNFELIFITKWFAIRKHTFVCLFLLDMQFTVWKLCGLSHWLPGK